MAEPRSPNFHGTHRKMDRQTSRHRRQASKGLPPTRTSTQDANKAVPRATLGTISPSLTHPPGFTNCHHPRCIPTTSAYFAKLCPRFFMMQQHHIKIVPTRFLNPLNTGEFRMQRLGRCRRSRQGGRASHSMFIRTLSVWPIASHTTGSADLVIIVDGRPQDVCWGKAGQGWVAERRSVQKYRC